MKGQSQKQTTVSDAPVHRAPVLLRGSAASPRGSGGEATSLIWVAASGRRACKRLKRYPTQTHGLLENKRHTQTKHMHQTENKLTLRHKKMHTALTLSLALLTIQLVSGCSTVSPKRQKIMNVLERQNLLISKIKAERDAEDIAAKVAGDPTLAPAEVRLNRGLDELTLSNQVIQDALTPKQHTREVLRER